MRLTEPDRIQGCCYSFLETWHSHTHKRFVSTLVSASSRFLRWSVHEVTKIEILIPLSRPNPIKTRNTAPARICNSRFSPLFSAQIPDIRAKTSQIPYLAKEQAAKTLKRLGRRLWSFVPSSATNGGKGLDAISIRQHWNHTENISFLRELVLF